MSRLLAIFILLILPLRSLADTGNNPTELSHTWQQAVVYVPSGPGQARRITTSDLPRFLQRYENPKVVLYAHGCSGIINIGREAGKFYAANGYIFVAPDSFARRIKPVSCRPALHQGGLHRAVLTWRQAEISNALTRLRALPGLKQAPIALIGHSEGGITVATYSGLPVTARIIEGWTCHAGWPEYHGLNAPRREPVLSLIGENDPWYKLPVLKGDCGAFMDGNDRSYVFHKPNRFHNKHWLSKHQSVRNIILKFLARHM
jgi:hypothetical protein